LVIRKSKSGVSTLVGGAIIIGIVLTILTPLFISANEMTSFYDTIALEMTDLDQQRSWEELEVFAQPTEDGVTLTITNIGSITVNITRIWVYPDNSEYNVFTQNRILRSGGQITIDDEDINNYVTSIVEETYSIKVATDRGNLFNARFASPPPPTPGYYFPLEVQQNSTCTSLGSTYDLHLEVWNWMDLEITIDYLIVTTSFSGGGTPSEVKMLEVNPDITFPREPPERADYWTASFTFSANPGADVIKVEIVDNESFVVGAFYFRDI
jgi:hypothetical protein